LYSSTNTFCHDSPIKPSTEQQDSRHWSQASEQWKHVNPAAAWQLRKQFFMLIPAQCGVHDINDNTDEDLLLHSS